MNLIDNGIKSVIGIKRVEEKEELYFEVQYVDWYNNTGTKRFFSIKDIENKSWRE